MEKSVTVISALCYIGRDKWKHSAFPPGVDRYKSWVSNLLSLDTQLYFFTDDYYYDYIVDIRKQHDPEFKKTVIKKVSLEELYFYKKYYIQEACLMFSPEFKEKVFFPDSADMNYPLYHIINFSKIEFVKTAAEENPYNSTHFFWSDAGGMRNSITDYKGTSWPEVNDDFFNDKIIHFSHREQYSIYPNKDEYFRSQDRNIQGTAWIVPKEKVNTFFDLIDNQVDTIIKEQIVGSDEKIYDFLYTENKDLYQLKQCSWFEFYNLCRSESQKRKKVFLDMGMHNQQGLYSFITNPDVGINDKWDIYCFEPNPLVGNENNINIPVLNINIIRKAVWTKNGTVKFGLYGDGTSQGSLIEETRGSEKYHDHHDDIEVECLDIYEFIQNLGDVDLYIKMDIEWSEYTVIEYMLSNGWPLNIKEMWVEWHGVNEEINIVKKQQLLDQIGDKTKMNSWI